MENNPTPTPKFKQLKITNSRGVVTFIPNNTMNRQHHDEHYRALTAAKKEKYKIQEVELELDEAVEIGIAEAIQIKRPPVRKGQVVANAGNDAVMKMLVEQNQKLMEMLEAKNEQANTKK